MRDRRAKLGLVQGLPGGPSKATWYKIENAVDPPFSPRTLHAVAAQLGWTPDSIDRILQWLDPIEVNGQSPPLSADPDRQAVIEAALERIEANVDKILADLGQQRADLAAMWIEPDLSDPSERTIWETTAYTVREKLAHIALKRQAEAPSRRTGRHRPP